MTGRIVLFGATGFTGERTARALVARGARPVLAGRSAERVQRLADELGGLDAAVADVARPETLRALVDPGDVLVSTVGPFTQRGDPAVQAAAAAGAHYLDSTGEPAFIRRVFESYGPTAERSGSALVTAFGFDFIPGNLAGTLALERAGGAASAVRVAYVVRGGGVSAGTVASLRGAVLEPSYAYRRGRLRTVRIGARAGLFTLERRRRHGISVGGSEHLALPAAYPDLQDVDVLLGTASWRAVAAPLVTAAARAAGRVPLLRRAVAGRAPSRPGSTPAGGRTAVVAEARSGSGERLSRVELRGGDPYDFTADMLAWGAVTAAGGGLRGVGALGPVAAFGLAELRAGAASAGLTVRRIAP